jgi:transcriptional regulator with XRE-family HTH domain
MDSRQEEIIIKDFGKRLKKARLAKGLSLRALADLADMNHGNIHEIELGNVNPQISTVVMLARALEIKPADLMPE